MTTLLRYELNPLARVSAGRSAQVLNSREIHSVIPGTTIRGALGSAWWRSPNDRYSGPVPQEAFATLFGAAMQVRQAIPVPLMATDQLARLEPLSWVRCKYPTSSCPTTWHDEVVSTRRECPVCRGPLKAGRGWNVPQQWSVSTTRTELAGGVAVDQRLYSRRALRHNGIRLVGSVRVRDDLAPKEALEWLLAPKEISVGGQLSTMGRCSWTCTKVDEPAEVGLPGAYALRLLSPAVLVDDLGAPTLDLAAAVERHVRTAGGHVQLGLVRTRPTSVSTWHGVAGLPKPEDWAVEAGSVVQLCSIDHVGLQALSQGVGIRRLEGYGTVSLVPVEALQRDEAPEAALLTTPPRPPVDVSETLPPGGTGSPAPRHTESPRVSPDKGAAPAAPSEPPASAEAPTPGRGPIDLLLDDILDPQTRAKTAKGMLAQGRNLKRMRDNGFPSSFIRGKVDEISSLAWMRDLSGPVQRLVLDLLASEELAAHVESLEAIVGSGS